MRKMLLLVMVLLALGLMAGTASAENGGILPGAMSMTIS